MPKKASPTTLRKQARALYAQGHPKIATRFMQEAKRKAKRQR